jgi:hypothetical protein
MTTRSSPEHPAGLVTLLLTPIGGIAASRQQTHRFLADRGRTDYSRKERHTATRAADGRMEPHMTENGSVCWMVRAVRMGVALAKVACCGTAHRG